MRPKRATFRGRAARIDPGRSVFLDGTGVNTAMARLYGRAPRGERLAREVPQAHCSDGGPGRRHPAHPCTPQVAFPKPLEAG